MFLGLIFGIRLHHTTVYSSLYSRYMSSLYHTFLSPSLAMVVRTMASYNRDYGYYEPTAGRWLDLAHQYFLATHVHIHSCFSAHM